MGVKSDGLTHKGYAGSGLARTHLIYLFPCFLVIFTYLFISLLVLFIFVRGVLCWYTCHNMHMVQSEQFVRVWYFLLQYRGIKGSNSGCQAWVQGLTY